MDRQRPQARASQAAHLPQLLDAQASTRPSAGEGSESMSESANIRYEMFAREYVVDLNATRSAIAAGYSEKSAESKGSQLLRNVKVRKLVDSYLSKRASKLEIKAEKVLEELARLAFCNMQDYIRIQNGEFYVDFSTLTRDQAAAIQEVTVEEYSEGRGEEKRDIKRTKFKLNDKRGALELLGKNLKLFTDKVEVGGKLEHEHSTIDPEKLTDAELAEAERLIESAHAGSNQR